MIAISRREFGKAVIAAAPFAAVAGSIRLAASSPLLLGVSTASFRDLPRITGRDNVDDVIRALRAVRTAHIELALTNVEPAPPNTAPFMAGSAAYPRRVVFSPEEIAAINAAARASLRTWRTQTAPGFFEDIRGRFAAAGLTVHACALEYDDSFTDDEIDATFRQVRALGVATVSSPMTLATATRLAPFVKRHQIAVAIHNQVDGNAAGAIATPQLKEALTLSPSFTLKLDIGNLTASNCDAVAELRDMQPRVSHVLVRDRLRNGGASQHFGEGDTPIAGVVNVLRSADSPIPALVEYDYVGVQSSVEEVTACVAYVAQAAK